MMQRVSILALLLGPAAGRYPGYAPAHWTKESRNNETCTITNLVEQYPLKSSMTINFDARHGLQGELLASLDFSDESGSNEFDALVNNAKAKFHFVFEPHGAERMADVALKRGKNEIVLRPIFKTENGRDRAILKSDLKKWDMNVTLKMRTCERHIQGQYYDPTHHPEDKNTHITAVRFQISISISLFQDSKRGVQTKFQCV